MDRGARKRYELQARIIQALAHPIRVAITDLLRDGEVCVCDIADKIGAERSNVSRHLAIMHRAGIVRARKEGLQVFYSLRTPCVLSFLSCATTTLEHNLKEDSTAMGRA